MMINQSTSSTHKVNLHKQKMYQRIQWRSAIAFDQILINAQSLA
jgi:hypothetical protein